MTRITDLSSADNLRDNDAIVVDGTNGTRKVTADQAFGKLADSFARNAWFHRNIYRGKNLGTTFTTAQKDAIRAGTFENLYIGDYWVNGGTTWIIADFDYWWNIGRNTNTRVNNHHVCVIPLLPIGTAKMNEQLSKGNGGGYLGADIRSKFQPILNQLNNFFGSSSILNAPRPFTSGSERGRATSMQWVDSCRLELMSERMVYGGPVFEILSTNANSDASLSWIHTTDMTQLSLFRLAPRFRMATSDAGIDTGWWLNTMAKRDHFCCVRYGMADCLPCDNVQGIRPIAGITG